jgi:hypothetical protein
MSQPKPGYPSRRMTCLEIKVPAELHRRFKTACAKAELSMTTEVLAFIKWRTEELELEGQERGQTL